MFRRLSWSSRLSISGQPASPQFNLFQKIRRINCRSLRTAKILFIHSNNVLRPRKHMKRDIPAHFSFGTHLHKQAIAFIFTYDFDTMPQKSISAHQKTVRLRQKVLWRNQRYTGLFGGQKFFSISHGYLAIFVKQCYNNCAKTKPYGKRSIVLCLHQANC